MVVWLRIAVLLVLWVVVPGVAAVLWFARRLKGERALEIAVACGVTLALAGWVLSSELLLRLTVLERGWVWVTAVAFGLIGALVATTEGRTLVRARRLPTGGDALRGAFVTAGLAIASAPHVIASLAQRNSLVSSTSWYYWRTSRLFAASGRVPRHITEWGTRISAYDLHLGFNASSAALALGGGRLSSLAAAHVVAVISVLLTIGGVWLFARSWGASTVTAVAAAFALIATQIFGIKLASYQPEALSYGFVFLSGALFKDALERHDARLLAVAAIGFATGSEIHGIGGAVAGAVLMATAAAFVALGDGVLRRRVVAAVAALAVAGAAWLGADLVLAARASNAGLLSSIPAITADGRDPTWEFLQLGSPFKVADSALGRDAPSYRKYVDTNLSFGFWIRSKTASNLLVIGVLGIVLVLGLTRAGVVRRFLGFTVVYLGLLVGVATVLHLGWKTWVPRSIGFYRIGTLWIIVVGVGGSVAAASVIGRWRNLAIGGWLAVCVLVWGLAARDIVDTRHQQPRPPALAALRSLDLRGGGFVLTNQYTEGFVAETTGRPGLLDGQAPYQSPELLARASRIMLDARKFFGDPRAAPFPMARYGVRYVLVSTEPFSLGSLFRFPTDLEALRADPALRLVRDGPGFTLYEVARDDGRVTGRARG